MEPSGCVPLTRCHEQRHHSCPWRDGQHRPTGGRPVAAARHARTCRLPLQPDPVRLVPPRWLGSGSAGRHHRLRGAPARARSGARLRGAGRGRRRAAPGPALRSRRRRLGRLRVRAGHALGGGRRTRLDAGVDRSACRELRPELRWTPLPRPADRRRTGATGGRGPRASRPRCCPSPAGTPAASTS
jgi:hypothetical protein